MKKTYIAPELQMQLMQVEGMIALSLQDSPADNSEVLVKDGNWGDIWDDADSDESAID